jgi:hypothetical protein
LGLEKQKCGAAYLIPETDKKWIEMNFVKKDHRRYKA